jgi:catechol 2,3-dioxygenase-like lactoylglutathione lyase family enzyme
MHELIRQLRHVGYVVDDLDQSVSMFRRLFDLDDADIRYVSPDETGGQVAFAFIALGGIELELIQPLTDAFRKMTGEDQTGITHFALQVADIDEVVRQMAGKGVRLGYITPNGVFDTGNKKIAYLDPADTGGNLIELVEITGDG